MFVEIHILQNFAPSNLNRDDTGAPKDCEFGGYRRARISSQCLKRAIRKDSGFQELMAGKGGVRTRRLIVEIAERVSHARPVPVEIVNRVAKVFEEAGIKRPKVKKGAQAEKDHTELVLFMEEPAIDKMAMRFKERWQQLLDGDGNVKSAVIKELGESLASSGKAPDIALFGRMIEIKPDTPFGKLQLGVDAACQVAHAFSTNKVSMEFDFYTAVDDLLGEQDRGAGMMGTVEFNSACFYRYANVDLEQLKKNLGGKEDLARQTLEAFLRASVDAVPTGKQNSMAAQNPPSLIFAVARKAGLWSLANAFLQPARPTQNGDLVQNSIAALDTYWGKLTRMYGDKSVAGKWACTLDGDGLQCLGANRVDSVDDLVQKVREGLASASDRKDGQG